MSGRLLAQMLDDVTCGDCIDVMAHLPAGCIDFVLTDPPYLVNYRDRLGRTIAGDRDDAWLEPAFRQVYRLLGTDTLCVSFYGWNHVDRFMAAWRAAGFSVAGHIVFRKPYASGVRFLRYEHEQAYLLAKGRPAIPDAPLPDVIDGWRYTGNRLHPTQKPVGVLSPLIDAFTSPGAIVLDPFCGSGSTLVAARAAGRRFIGIELASEYHHIARSRIVARP